MDYHLLSICKRSLLSAAVNLALFFLISVPAFAQVDPTATTVVSPTATISTTAITTATVTAQVTQNGAVENVVEPTETTEARDAAKAILRWLVSVTLLFSMLVLLGMFIYTYRIQMKYYEVMEKLSDAGMTLRMKVIATFSKIGGTLASDDADPSFTLTIEGPATLTVDTLSDSQ